MIAVRVGPDIRSAVVASPAYLEHHLAPIVPQDLARHRCINYRFAGSGRLYTWEFQKAGRSMQVRVEGQLVLNDSDLVRSAVHAGLGLAYAFEDQIADDVAAGLLVRVLEDWSWTAPGYYLYYTSRRQIPPALAALVETLRYRPP